jgi:17beta-estradiol 17-dehydrogenase / very-long-chain 3-oxoacyl-CoA reductase
MRPLLSQPHAQHLAKESRIVTIDFGNPSPSAYDNLKSAITGLDAPVGVLVNNVGVSHAMPVDFLDCPDSEMEKILEINCRATMRVTKLVLPSMVSRCVPPVVTSSPLNKS